jgi:rhamnogalacturonyl hydrolase YesR
LQAAKEAYDWTFKAKLIDQGKVYDGAYNPRCWQIEKKEHSYNSGLFLGVAGMLYKATGDEKYMRHAKTVLTRSQSVFTKNGVIIDECEPTNSCKVNQAAFKGIFVRAIGYLYSTTNDESMRTTIKNMITTSAEGMAATCNDKWACNVLWTPGSPAYSDVHTQNTALELFNVLTLVTDSSDSSDSAPVNNTQNNSTSSNNNNSTTTDDIIFSSSALSMFPQFILLIASLWMI